MREYTKIRLPYTTQPDRELTPAVNDFLESLDLTVRTFLCARSGIRQLHLHTVEAVTFYLRGVAVGRMPCPNVGGRVRQELQEKLSYYG